MDPIANLIDQLLLVQAIEDAQDNLDEDGELTQTEADCLMADGVRLAELVRALHEWIWRGGFNPYNSDQARSQVKQQAKARGWRG